MYQLGKKLMDCLKEVWSKLTGPGFSIKRSKNINANRKYTFKSNCCSDLLRTQESSTAPDSGTPPKLYMAFEIAEIVDEAVSEAVSKAIELMISELNQMAKHKLGLGELETIGEEEEEDEIENEIENERENERERLHKSSEHTLHIPVPVPVPQPGL